MKVTIIGAGAVGTYYSAKFALAGLPVTLLARGQSLQVLQSGMATIESYEGDFQVNIPVTDRPEALGQPNLLILAVKTYDTDAAIAQIRPAIGPQTICMSLQNGVEKERKLVATFGKERVIGAVCYIGAEMTKPGTVVHSARGSVTIGELDGRRSERIARIQSIFTHAGIPTEISEKILQTIWTKLCWNSAFNQVCALSRCDVAQALDSPPLVARMRAVMAEVMQIAAANKVPLPPDTIDKMFSFSTAGLKRVRPSMLQDLEKGNRLEHEAFAGFIMREGKRLGIAVPENEMLYRALASK